MDNLTNNITFLISAITVLAFILNIPLGFLRSKQKKFSLKWIVYIHLAIPAIIALRISLHLGNYVIPIFVISSIIGQVVGARLNPERIS